jgi:hypothetical protein
MKSFKVEQLWKYLPLLAPIPEGYAVGLAVARELKWNPLVVFVSALLVAGTGFYAIQTANRMSEFNATTKEKENKEIGYAPTWRALIVVGIWFTGVVALTLFLDVYPVIKTLAPIALVLIGFSAAWLGSINQEQTTREQARDELRAQGRKKKEQSSEERKASRNARKAEGKKAATLRQAMASQLQALASDGKGKMKVRMTRKGAVSDEQLLSAYIENPFVPSSELAERFNVSRQAIDQRRDALAEKGFVELVRNESGRVAQVKPVGTLVSAVGEGR